jgi:hypothetical protein
VAERANRMALGVMMVLHLEVNSALFCLSADALMTGACRAAWRCS